VNKIIGKVVGTAAGHFRCSTSGETGNEAGAKAKGLIASSGGF
jgi:hypothetical protein